MSCYYTSTKYKFSMGILDEWSTKETLALASSVKRSGDQNWVSVSRAIKPYGEPNRPPDWFSQKNCALQYAELLDNAEIPKRKRGEKGEVAETPNIQIVRKLTIERIEELMQLVQEEQQRYKKIKMEVDAIKAGDLDDTLGEIWGNIQTQQQEMEERRREEEREAAQEAFDRAQKRSQSLSRAPSTSSIVSEVDDSTQDSVTDQVNVETTDDELPSNPTVIRPISIDIPLTVGQEPNKPAPPTSPLLSSLLASKQYSVDSLQQIKAVAEAEHAKQTHAANQNEGAEELTNPEMVPKIEDKPDVGSLPVLDVHRDLGPIVSVPYTAAEVTIVTSTETKTEVIDVGAEEVIEVEMVPVKEEIEIEMVEIETVTYESPEKVPKPEPVIHSEEEPDIIEPPPAIGSYVTIDDEAAIKDEPLSPASSVSSRLSEAGSRSSGRKKGRSAGNRRSGIRGTRRSTANDDLSSRPSDAETSDFDDDSSFANPFPSGMSALSESIPNSPVSHCSDTEDDKAYKTWKKSIMLVWRAAANHKFASVFLHPVTNDIAPGYTTIVKRPKDLIGIKRHLENGTIRTTSEFQRDMMLMFTNAIMYNSSDHDVFKMATDMYEDVMQHIEQYVNAQLMVQNTETKLLRQPRRNESSDKEDESRRRRTSSEAEGGKTKKRKSRAEDT